MDLSKTPGTDSGMDSGPDDPAPVHGPKDRPPRPQKDRSPIDTSPASSGGGGTGKGSGLVGTGGGDGSPDSHPERRPADPKRPTRRVLPPPSMVSLLRMRRAIRGEVPRTDPDGDPALSKWLANPDRAYRANVVSWVPHEAGIRDAAAVVTRFPPKFVTRLVLKDILAELRWQVRERPLAAGWTFLDLAVHLAGVHADRIDTLRCLDDRARALAVRHLQKTGFGMAVCEEAARELQPNASAAQHAGRAAHAYTNALLYLESNPLPDDMTVTEFLRWQVRGNGGRGGDGGGGGGKPKIPGPQPRPFSEKIQEADAARQARINDREQQAFRDRMAQIKRTAEATARSDQAVAAILKAGEELALGGYDTSPDDGFDGAVYNWIIDRYRLIEAIATEHRLSNTMVAALQAHVVWATGVMAERRELARAAYSCRSRTLGEAIRVAVSSQVREVVLGAVHDLYTQSLGSHLPGFAGTIAADLTRGGQFGPVADARVSESLRRIRWRVRRSFDENGPGNAFGLGFNVENKDIGDHQSD